MRTLHAMAGMGIGLALPNAALASAQLSELGRSFDCQLQGADLSKSDRLTADPASKKSSVYIWFGRFLAASKETGGQPIPLVVDPDRIAAPVGAGYQGFDEWPAKFRLKASDAAGSRMLMVEGDKPIASAPDAFKAGLIVLAPGSTGQKARITRFMTGQCVVTANAPYTEYQKRVSQ